MKRFLFGSILLIIVILAVLYFFGLNSIKKDIKLEFGLVEGSEKDWTEAFQEYEILQCKSGILKAEFVFVSYRDYSYRNENRELWKTTFYQAIRPHLFSVNWDTQYTGGTTVKNVTFDELVKMVKEDCDQFQDGHVSDVEGEPEWVYTRAKTKEEKVADIKEGFLANENRYSSFREIYGDVEQMTDEEVLALHEKIKEEGLDERVDTEMKADWIRDKVYDLSEDQWEKVKARYGDLLELSDEELIEKDKEITADWESGEFVLIEE